MYLDSDHDASTGIPHGGMGAELRWAFGARRGVFLVGGDSTPVEHQHIGLMTAPTVSSREFEIVLSRSAEPVSGRSLFSGPMIRVAFADGREGDLLPDSGGIEYTFSQESLPAIPAIALEKRDPSHLRILAYNVNNGMFRSERAEAYRRILGAIQPDLLTFMEVRDNTSEQTVSMVAPLINPSMSGAWHHAKAGAEGNVVMSPFPIRQVHQLGNSGAFVLDATEEYATEMLVIVLSAPSGRQNAARQHEFDMIMAFVRDAKSPGGEFDLEPNTPMVLIGDANLVGYAQQRRTLLAGDIVDTDQFGFAFAPDWDGSQFRDLMPVHTHAPLTFTWYGESFSPGRLDYVVYSDAVVDVGNGFVLFTPGMPEAALSRYGLMRDDTHTATDHLPVVADFVFR